MAKKFKMPEYHYDNVSIELKVGSWAEFDETHRKIKAAIEKAENLGYVSIDTYLSIDTDEYYGSTCGSAMVSYQRPLTEEEKIQQLKIHEAELQAERDNRAARRKHELATLERLEKKYRKKKA